MALLFVLDVAWWFKAVGAAALALSSGVQLRQSVLRLGDHSLVAVHIDREDRLTVETRSGARLECEVLASTFVSALITVLNVRIRNAQQRRSAVICSDCVDADDFRKLRIWLRWKATMPSAELNGFPPAEIDSSRREQ